MPQGAPYPIRVTETYLQERQAWEIYPCQSCGLGELFDPPSTLLRRQYPNTPDLQQIEAATLFCPLCGGVQTMARKNSPLGSFKKPRPLT